MVMRKNEYRDKEKLRKARNRQRKRYYKKTQMYPYKAWDNTEVDLILNKTMTDHELSKKLQRSVQSIQVKRSRIKNGYESR